MKVSLLATQVAGAGVAAVLVFGLVGCGQNSMVKKEESNQRSRDLGLTSDANLAYNATEVLNWSPAPSPSAASAGEEILIWPESSSAESGDQTVEIQVPQASPLPSNSEDGQSGGNPDVVLDDADLLACSKSLKVAVNKIHVAGQYHDVNLGADNALFVKITGNQNKVNLTVNGIEGAGISGMCVFLAGNRAEFTMQTNSSVGHVVYIGRGNLSKGDISVARDRMIANLEVDLKGNQATLNVSGEGQYDCTSANVGGHDSQLRCH